MIIQGRATVRPTALLLRMRQHGEVSEGSRSTIVATRNILGRMVDFYRDGRRVVRGLEKDLDEAELYESEVLRFAQASILINDGVGDRRLCYVDATTDPAEVWVYGQRIDGPRRPIDADESFLDLDLYGKTTIIGGLSQ